MDSQEGRLKGRCGIFSCNKMNTWYCKMASSSISQQNDHLTLHCDDHHSSLRYFENYNLEEGSFENYNSEEGCWDASALLGAEASCDIWSPWGAHWIHTIVFTAHYTLYTKCTLHAECTLYTTCAHWLCTLAVNWLELKRYPGAVSRRCK